VKITKQELKDIIKEVISEQTVPREIEDAVRADEKMEELLRTMEERMSALENEIKRLELKYSNASARMGQITGEQE
jgi:hypothetical protein